MIRLYEDKPDNLVVAGRPEGLFGYSIEKLVKSGNALQTFERWAEALLKILQPLSGSSVFSSSTRRVDLLSFGDFKVKHDTFFQRIKNIFRKYLHSDKLFAKAYSKRFRLLTTADHIVYSGAGEVGDNNIFLRQLLELRVAQKLGKRTFAINQSVEVAESPMREICALVYKKMTGIIVRGEVSKKNIESMGVDARIIQCYPDTAFLNPRPNSSLTLQMAQKYTIKLPAVGLNATKVADDLHAWGEIIELLKSLGYHIYFISNDPFGDKAIGQALSSAYGIVPILEFMDYPKYTALLANFKFVISCRLHTNELSLTGGTPVIPIEGSHFKTKEVFSLLEYPLAVVNASQSSWSSQIKEYIRALHNDRSAVEGFISKLEEVRKLSLYNRVV